MNLNQPIDDTGRPMTHFRPFSTLVALLMLSSCFAGNEDELTTEPSDATAYCENIAAARCSQALACFGPDELAELGLPTNLESCQKKLETELWCSEFPYCGPGMVLDEDEALACAQGYRDFSCQAIEDELTPASCSLLCRRDGKPDAGIVTTSDGG